MAEQRERLFVQENPSALSSLFLRVGWHGQTRLPVQHERGHGQAGDCLCHPRVLRLTRRFMVDGALVA